MTAQRRVARGAQQQRPGPKRRTPKSHDRVRNPSRNRHRREQVKNDQPVSQKFFRGATKVLGQLVLILAIVAVFVFFVFPTGSYVDQRNDLQDAEAQLEDLLEDNADLEAQIVRLGSEDEIEREAREFGLVRPEEENYLIIAPGD